MILGAAALVLLGVLLLSGYVKASSARDHLERGRVSATAAVQAASSFHFADADGLLRDAAAEFLAAASDLDSAPFSLVSWAPFVGRNVSGVKALARAGAVGVDGVRRAVEAAALLPNANGRPAFPVSHGKVDSAVLDQVVPLLDQAGEGVAEAERLVGLVPPGLVAQAERTRLDLGDKLRQAEAQLSRARDLLALLRSAVEQAGGRRYLLVFENTSEMRGLAGMPLSWAELDIAGGTISLVKTGSVFDLAPGVASDVDLPPDYRDRFGWQSPSLSMVNTTAGLDFPTAAPVLAAIYERSAHIQVDGVLAADSVFLAGLAAATGPVSVGSPPVVVLPSQAERFLLHDQYLLPAGNVARHELLGEFAQQVANALFDGRADPAVLGQAVSKAAAERRLVFWLRDPDDDALAQRLGISGSFPDGPGAFAGATVQNHTGTKLDYYVSTSMNIEAFVTPAGAAIVTESVTVDNQTRPDAVATDPPAVVGPYASDADGNALLPAGWYRGWVSLYSSPGAAALGTSLSGDAAPLFEVEATHTVVSGFVIVPPGEKRTATATFSIPSLAVTPGHYLLDALPQPRSRPTTLTVAIHFPPGRVTTTTEGAIVDGSTVSWTTDAQKLVDLAISWSAA